MLRFHIQNVGQGDSIIVEHHDGQCHSFGVVDSNIVSGETPKALTRLQELGAQQLSFVCLTHPHRDHFRGLSEIMQAFEGKIDQFIIFPAGEYIGANARDLAKKYRELAKSQDDPDVTKSAWELVRIFALIDKSKGFASVAEYAGPHNQVPVQGFNGVEVMCVLPFRKFKDTYLQKIRRNDPTIFESEEENDLSLVLLFRYQGVNVLLGGDATKKNWREHMNHQHTRGLNPIHSTAVKIPHHGSKHDCTADVLEVAFLTKEDEERYAFISANGVKHPHEDVLQALEDRNIKPYCTNLHKKCGANVHKFIKVAGLDPVLGKYINQLSEEVVVQPCQGDITFEIDETGATTLSRQRKIPCGFRGELNFLPNT